PSVAACRCAATGSPVLAPGDGGSGAGGSGVSRSSPGAVPSGGPDRCGATGRSGVAERCAVTPCAVGADDPTSGDRGDGEGAARSEEVPGGARGAPRPRRRPDGGAGSGSGSGSGARWTGGASTARAVGSGISTTVPPSSSSRSGFVQPAPSEALPAVSGGADATSGLGTTGARSGLVSAAG